MSVIEEPIGRLSVCVERACMSYGSLEVLCHLNMNVTGGSIYGLLGSSGCGKTTLLRCILGRLNLNSGHVTVLGKPPGSRDHHVPGRDVGYMPQETALYGDLTMLETMLYFGILHRMSRKRVRDRGNFLLTLLELPSQTKLIRKLSGGQKRRVSFAVAMLQEPPLLILDEPTVGVDPLLRAKIWQHLLELVSTQHTTIIITTHYIEEARQANVVGLMRDGQIMAESEPCALINFYGMSTLEEHLCRKQESRSILSPVNGLPSDDDLSSSTEETPLLVKKRRVRERVGSQEEVNKQSSWSGECSRLLNNYVAQGFQDVKSSFTCNFTNCCPHPLNILALCWKNVAKIYRNPWIVIFQFLIPTLQVSLLCLTIGPDLHGVNMAYVNADKPGSTASHCTGHDNLTTGGWYIDFLSKGDTFQLHEHKDEQSAIQQVKDGRAWAAVVIGESFTADLFKRTLNDHSESTIEGSTIYLYMDITNTQISAVIENKTAGAFMQYADKLFNVCSVDSALLSPPLKMHQPPVYGKAGLSFTDYMGPGVVAS